MALSEDNHVVQSGPIFRPIFDFSDSSLNETDRFERIDDAVMGGISSSFVRQVPGESFARWSGVCRVDGGGVWKLTTRTDSARGEQLYQAQVKIPNTKRDNEFFTLQVPFEDFRLVRGPRLVSDAAQFNKTLGIFQIGLIMSKFAIAEQMTAIPNFRPGFFELQIGEIGIFYKNGASLPPASNSTVKSLSREEVIAARPVLMKALVPLSKVFFTEKSQRRKSAMRLLKDERGLSRLQAIAFGIKWRANQRGMMNSLLDTCKMLFVDACRVALGSMFRYGIFLPLRLITRSVKRIAGLISRKCKAESEG
ncbi:expressed unknown protein [Seminavis robusta]|uniref:NADH:ubiquinone oxidoreductase intermediate-associated protein 30 domain-containing protein n=1 Tax=Seminavis robusta TaxID=568900 RepID=A0A9N8HME4_9STRA|nr:expressed unknown protein [Seminavis robusta]|eukprot:Sro891_g216820.1 n/a (308) ;mRNA; f:21837-23087